MPTMGQQMHASKVCDGLTKNTVGAVYASEFGALLGVAQGRSRCSS